MKKRYLLALMLLVSCEILDNDPQKHVSEDKNDSTYIALEEVAHILSEIPLSYAQFKEVHQAVTSSSGNGYDEEYTMKNLFGSPGTGVGDQVQTRSEGAWDTPLRELIGDYLRSRPVTRSGQVADAEIFLKCLEESDVQIYWPFSESWDGRESPVITFDPEDGSEVNTGYMVSIEDDGSRHVQEVVVDEEMAKERPVWVVNRNSDAGYTSLEMLRREDPDWGEGGGSIIVKPLSDTDAAAVGQNITKSGDKPLRTLILKDFTMHRQYDSWFAGASEFFVKIGSVEDFTASTEAELQLYDPVITDFMIVVKRNQVGIPQPFNAILVSEWTDQLTHCALMIIEDDGGTRKTWDCSASVKIQSKTYGFDISIPFNSRDDIVWRGQLAGRWIEQNSNLVGRFGDLNLTFEVLEY